MTATREAQAEEIVADNNRGVIRSITRAQATQIVLVLLGMMVLFTIINPDAFLSVFNFRSIIVNASIFIILGVGVTFVIVTAGIDLSIGSVLVFASVMSALVMESLGTEDVYKRQVWAPKDGLSRRSALWWRCSPVRSGGSSTAS